GGHHAHDIAMPIVRMKRRRTHQRAAPLDGGTGRSVGFGGSGSPLVPAGHGERLSNPGPTQQRFSDWARQILVSRYAPACVLTDREGQVLYFSGATHDYLVQPIGLPTRDVFALSREGLGPKLHEAVLHVQDSHAPVSVEEVKVR